MNTRRNEESLARKPKTPEVRAEWRKDRIAARVMWGIAACGLVAMGVLIAMSLKEAKPAGPVMVEDGILPEAGVYAAEEWAIAINQEFVGTEAWDLRMRDKYVVAEDPRLAPGGRITVHLREMNGTERRDVMLRWDGKKGTWETE